MRLAHTGPWAEVPVLNLQASANSTAKIISTLSGTTRNVGLWRILVTSSNASVNAKDSDPS